LNRQPNEQVRFDILGQADWRYQAQASDNLRDWQDLGTVLATNSTISYLDGSSAGSPQRFFRVVTLP
jgi:hypothetical protein